MLQSTDHDSPQASSSRAFRAFMRATPALAAVMLLGVANQSAVANPITITQQSDLVFGRYAATQSQGGTVTINPTTGGKTVTGPLFDFGAAHQRAKFHITGDSGKAFSITLPSQITITAGSETMTVNAFTSDPSGSPLIDPDSTKTLWVGATLNLSANQASGSYTGQFTVTVEMQ